MAGKKSDGGRLSGHEKTGGPSMRARIVNALVCAIEKRTALPADAEFDPFNYVDTGHVDSIEMIKFVLEIEMEFDIEITAADMGLAGFKTIGGLAEIVEEKLKDIGRANDPVE